MPLRSLRRRSPAIDARRTKPPHHPSPSPRPRKTPLGSSASSRSKPIPILKRCSSAPSLFSDSISTDGDRDHNFRLLRPQTFSHAFESSPSLLPSSPQSNCQIQGYRKEAKVVVSVTVEGSPGPIRTMVKLGSSVEDTIRLVVDKYSEEGRTPKIDADAVSSFQLYDSHFSLQGLDKSEVIGDVGSRSFFLRKSNETSPFSSFRSESDHDLATESTAAHSTSTPPPPFILHSFISRKINKMMRRARKLWKILVCLQ